MHSDEDRIFAVLQQRDFFKSVQQSLHDWLDGLAKDNPDRVFYRGKMRAEYKRYTTLAEEAPPYEQLSKEILPAVLYSAERWKQMTDPDVVTARPYLRYVSACLPDSRPSHVEKHGLIYPVNHPFWNEWMPPNGFACLCSVTSVSLSLLARRKGNPDWRMGIPIEQFKWPLPDEGFRFNPGKLI